MELHEMPISQLRALLDSKQLSAAELTKHYIERASRASGIFNTLCPERAMEQASRAQKLINEGNVRMLTGIPIAVEDDISTRFVRTTCASRFLEWYIPSYDNTVMRKLVGYGTVLLGKLTMGEFGTTPASHGECVSGGYAACSLGAYPESDAYFLKPTYGSISRDGFITADGPYAQLGVCAKTANDFGVVLDAITDYDPYDSTMSNPASYCYSRRIGQPLGGIRIGAIDSALCGELEKLGCVIEKAALGHAYLAPAAYRALTAITAACELSGWDGTVFGAYRGSASKARTGGLVADIKRRVLLGTYISGGKLERQANAARDLLKKETAELLKKHDALLLPANGQYENALALCGLPVLHARGVLIAAGSFNEELLIQLSAALEVE